MTLSNATIADDIKNGPRLDLRLLLAACSLLLLLSMWSYAWFLLSNAKREVIDKANQDATTSVRLLAEYTRNLIHGNEQLMQILLERHARVGQQADMAGWIRETGLDVPFHTGIWILGPDGKVQSSSLPGSRSDLRQLEAFQYQAGKPLKKLYISRPLQDPDSKRWEIHLSKRINAADGRFLGVILTSVDLQNFNRFYNEIHLNANDSLTLVGDDGVIRARKSGITTSLGLDVSNGKIFPVMQREGNGITTNASKVDGRTRSYAFRKLENYGLYVMMGIDYEDSLRPYLTRERNTWQLATIVTLITLAISLLIHNLISRLLRSRQQALAASEIQQQLLRDMERQRSTIEDSHQHLQAIWANAVDAMLIVDEKQSIESINPAAARLFGAEPGQMTGNALQALIPDLHLPDLPARLAAGVQQAVEVSCRRPAGGSFPAELAWGQFHLGPNLKWILSLHDTTERKRIEQMKTDFVATVSEELRVPLAMIRNTLASILEQHGAAVSAPVPGLLQAAQQQGERLHGLINDLLDVHELEVGRMHFSLQTVPLAPLLNKSLGNMHEFAASHGVSIALVGGIPDCMLEVDPDRLEQVLHNLLSNACKFSHRNGTVTVQAHLMGGNRVRIAIMDRGIGIAEELRSHLFERFAHASHDGMPGKTGAGLGLMLAKVIVEHMQGEIGYHSIPAQGSTFHIELPAEPD